VSSPKEPAGSRLRTSRNVVSRVVADEAVVVPIRSGVGDLDSIYTFNGTGTVLWQMLEAGESVDVLSRYLQQEFGISEDQANADLEAFLLELAEENLTEQV